MEPPRSADPIMGGPIGRSRREAGTRERPQTPVTGKCSKALEIRTPNREELNILFQIWVTIADERK